jgi:hypothetical protein
LPCSLSLLHPMGNGVDTAGSWFLPKLGYSNHHHAMTCTHSHLCRSFNDYGRSARSLLTSFASIAPAQSSTSLPSTPTPDGPVPFERAPSPSASSFLWSPSLSRSRFSGMSSALASFFLLISPTQV